MCERLLLLLLICGIISIGSVLIKDKQKGYTMTEEAAVQKAARKSNNGEGWYLMVRNLDEDGFAMEAGPCENLKAAEAELKAQAQMLDGKEVLIAKIQRRVKVKVETVKMVKFE